jgi:hypothetical protein
MHEDRKRNCGSDLRAVSADACSVNFSPTILAEVFLFHNNENAREGENVFSALSITP